MGENVSKPHFSRSLFPVVYERDDGGVEIEYVVKPSVENVVITTTMVPRSGVMVVKKMEPSEVMDFIREHYAVARKIVNNRALSMAIDDVVGETIPWARGRFDPEKGDVALVFKFKRYVEPGGRVNWSDVDVWYVYYG